MKFIIRTGYRADLIHHRDGLVHALRNILRDAHRKAGDTIPVEDLRVFSLDEEDRFTRVHLWQGKQSAEIMLTPERARTMGTVEYMLDTPSPITFLVAVPFCPFCRTTFIKHEPHCTRPNQ